MLYVIYAQDIADSLEKRLSVRPAHLARLQLLHDEGRLLTAGPMPAVDRVCDILGVNNIQHG